MNRNNPCFVLRGKIFRSATFVEKYDFKDAVKVLVDGEEWVVTEPEVFTPAAKIKYEQRAFYAENRPLLDAVKSCEKPNKAEIARGLSIKYHIALARINKALEMGIDLKFHKPEKATA